MRDQDLSLSGVSYEVSLGQSEEETSWVRVLAGLSFMRSWGDMDYTDDGVDGVLESDLNTFHPYLYWQPNERVSVWGLGGMGWGEVDVKEPGRTHDFDADFRMLAGGVRSVLCRGALQCVGPACRRLYGATRD